MAYTQVQDILQQAQCLKSRVEEVCENRRHATGDDIFREVLHRVDQHEKRMHEHLEKYEKDASQGILETWIQFSAAGELEQAVGALDNTDEKGDDEVLQLILVADHALLEVIELAARQVTAPHVQEYFQNLLDMEDQKARAMGRDVIEMEDLRGSS